MRKPDYQRDGITLYCGDCLEIIPEIGRVDAVVTSPPYNQRLDKIKASGFKKEGNAVWAERIASSYFDSMPEDQYVLWQTNVLNALFEIGSADCSLFYNHKCRWRDKVLLHPLDIVRQSRWKLRKEIIWSRDGSLTQNARMFPPSEERVIWMYKERWKWNDDSNRFMSVWNINSVHNSEHPVAFPVEIPRRCVEASTNCGDIVVDPFAGSATTGVACVELNRRFIGIEKDPAHFAIAVKRIDAALDADRDSLFPVRSESMQLGLFTEQDTHT